MLLSADGNETSGEAERNWNVDGPEKGSHKVSCEFFHEMLCVCVLGGGVANPQEKPAEPERLALAVHVLNVGMVVSVYGGVLNLFSMSHGHLHTLYTLPQRVWAYKGHTHTRTPTHTCQCSFLLFAG